MEYLPISELTPYPDNPRKWDDEDIFRLAESIRSNPELFEARPVIVSARKDGTKYVLGGHLRIEAAKRLGKTEVPVYRFVGLTKDKEREILLRDNIQNGEWDWDKILLKWDDLPFDAWGLNAPFEDLENDLGDNEEHGEEVDDPQGEWQGMPEYEHDDLTAYKSIVVNFSCENDIKELSDLLGQLITNKTKYIWFPPVNPIVHGNLRYTSE